MSVWTIHERARNIRPDGEPHYVTVWCGTDEEGNEKWLVNNKPDPDREGGPIFGVNGGPHSHDGYPDNLEEAIEQYLAELEEDEQWAKTS